ncbi:MAG TPA: ferritin-like domain-containing protein [Actinoplanes sp.]
MSEELSAALAAEEAAIYAYGVIGVHLTATADIAEARAAEQVHRTRRDAVVSRLAALNASTAPAPAAYRLPFPVTGTASALKLAIHVEDGVAAAWRAVLPASEGDDRSAALAALTDAAVRATRWRRRAGVTPETLPFPGR